MVRIYLGQISAFNKRQAQTHASVLDSQLSFARPGYGVTFKPVRDFINMNNFIASVMIFGIAFGISMAEAKPGNENSLPPGLQKKVARGGALPPGWQKKLAVGEYLDIDVYRRASIVVPVGNTGMITVEIDGRVLMLALATREIIEILK